jgi:hypothetical protein
MALTARAVDALVDQELRRIAQPELVSLIRSLRIPTRCERRSWDYGEREEAYSCWIVLEHAPSNTCIAYCEEGFGPRDPWGLLFIKGSDISMGMDSQWFVNLEDAVRQSTAWEGTNPPGYEVR